YRGAELGIPPRWTSGAGMVETVAGATSEVHLRRASVTPRSAIQLTLTAVKGQSIVIRSAAPRQTTGCAPRPESARFLRQSAAMPRERAGCVARLGRSGGGCRPGPAPVVRFGAPATPDKTPRPAVRSRCPARNPPVDRATLARSRDEAPR